MPAARKAGSRPRRPSSADVAWATTQAEADRFDVATEGVVIMPDAWAGIQAAKIARNGGGPDLCWVIALGSNDAGHLPESWWRASINGMMGVVGDDPAMWVNVWMDSTPTVKGYTTTVSALWNADLALWLQSYASQPAVADWAAVMSTHPDWFDAGGMHLTPAGDNARAEFVAAAAVAYFGGLS